MTDIDTMRDELAGLCGWSQSDWGSWVHPNRGERLLEHPLPPGDLTALAAAWPEAWMLYRDFGGWWASRSRMVDGRCRVDCVKSGNTGDEYADRLVLTLAALKAERGEHEH